MKLFCIVTACFIATHLVGGEPVLPTPPSNKDYAKFALLQEGDVSKGQSLFKDEQRLACSRCHSIDGRTSTAGPNLFAVGDKLGRHEIIDSLLTPSATIADGYHTTILELRGGDEVSGIVKEVTAEWVELMGADTNRVRIPARDIVSRRTGSESLMPEGLPAGLTLAEFCDLTEYLVSLKQPESDRLLHHGMPAVIPALVQPVLLRPMVDAEAKFDHPVWLGAVPGVTNELLIIEHESNKIWRVPTPGKTNAAAKTVFADFGPIKAADGGLMAIAWHPRFRENRKYYLFSRTAVQGHFAVVILEREVAADGSRDAGRESRVLLKVPQVTPGHFGGWLEFGPDGFLYISLGDSGPQEDPQGNSQNRRLMLGKFLRIDVDRADDGKAYAVPADNPFLSQPEMPPEVWAVGFRAPWRFSFDQATGDLWVGDVGQDRYEKVTIVRRGENHGWNVYEAFTPFSNRYRRDGEIYVPPVFAYARKYGPSVTGGFVYRADPHSSFYGAYIFGDYESRRLFALTQEDRVLKKVRQIGTAPQRVVSFGRDERGEIYVVGYEGLIFRIDFGATTFE